MRESNEAIRLYRRKLKVISDLRSILDATSIKRASKDQHSYRKPRPCGMTIHPGIGCVHGCIYCYLPDMGISNLSVHPYDLSGTELAYSLALNPYVVPERTLAAFGSITEPLLPQVISRTLEYLESIVKWLGLPSQLSTKVPISSELANRLKSIEPNLSVLVTIVTIKYYKKLEPRAPTPLSRFKGLENAARAGLRADLFLRPIIPGITDNDINDILKLAKEHKVTGVIVGSLRVTKDIVERLRRSGLLSIELIKYLPRGLSSRQVSINTSVIKNKVRSIAEHLGLEYMQSACAANIKSHNLYCSLCNFGPCGKGDIDVDRIINEVREFIEFLGGYCDVEYTKSVFKVIMRKPLGKSLPIDLRCFLRDTYKVRFIIRNRH